MNEETFRAIINPWLDRRTAQVPSDYFRATFDADEQAKRHGSRGGSGYVLILAKIPQRLSESVVEDACALIAETPGLFSQFQSFERGFFAIFDDLAEKITKKIESPFSIYSAQYSTDIWVKTPDDLIQLGKDAVTASRLKFVEYVSMQKALVGIKLGVKVDTDDNTDTQAIPSAPRPRQKPRKSNQKTFVFEFLKRAEEVGYLEGGEKSLTQEDLYRWHYMPYWEKSKGNTKPYKLSTFKKWLYRYNKGERLP